MNTKTEIEEQVLKTANALLRKWSNKFSEISVMVDDLSIYHNDSTSEHFSPMTVVCNDTNGFGVDCVYVVYKE